MAEATHPQYLGMVPFRARTWQLGELPGLQSGTGGGEEIKVNDDGLGNRMASPYADR